MTWTALTIAPETAAKVTGDGEPALEILSGPRTILNKSIVSFDAAGAATLETRQSDAPEEGDLVAALSKRTGGNIKVTRSFPISGDEDVAEFKAGWRISERSGQWLSTAAGTKGVQQDTDETWCAAADQSVDCDDGSGDNNNGGGSPNGGNTGDNTQNQNQNDPDVDDDDEESGGAMGLILAVIGILAAISIAILVYCFCCKTNEDDDF